MFTHTPATNDQQLTDLLGMRGVEEPPGMTARRLSQPPMTPPACLSMSSLSGIDISSSTVHGLFTWPDMLNSCQEKTDFISYHILTAKSSTCGYKQSPSVLCFSPFQNQQTSLHLSYRLLVQRQPFPHLPLLLGNQKRRRLRGTEASTVACLAYPLVIL